MAQQNTSELKQNVLLPADTINLNKNLPLSELKNGSFQNSANHENIQIDKRMMKRQRVESKGRIKTPQAVAVARRNARERNRVKQVNNGFAALRQHIPNEIAEMFEQVGSKAAAKKLSKVETLRMAVEYIRHLEDMLSNDSSIGSMSSDESYLPATPPPETTPQQTCFYTIKPRNIYNVIEDTSKLSETQLAIINGQCVRFGSNTFQLLIGIDENNENIKPEFSVLPAGSIMHSSSLEQSKSCLNQSVTFSADSIKPEQTALANISNSFIAITPHLLEQIKSEKAIQDEVTYVDSHTIFASGITDVAFTNDVDDSDTYTETFTDSEMAYEADDSKSWHHVVKN